MNFLIIFFISLIYESLGYKRATKYSDAETSSNEKVLSKHIKKRSNDNWDKERIKSLMEKHMMASEDDLIEQYVSFSNHGFFVAVSKGHGNASDQIELRGDFIKHEANGMLAFVLRSQLTSSYQNCNLEQISNFTTPDSIANYILQACPQVKGIAVLGSGLEWKTLYGGYYEGFDSIQSGDNDVWYTRIPVVDTPLKPIMGTTPYGQLAISGKYLIQASTSQPVQLRGMSLFWSQWMGQFYNAATVTALKSSWNTNVVRAALGVEPKGYSENKQVELQKVCAVIEAAIASGIYVVVDWHDYNAQDHQSEAIEFFQNISQKYGNYPNIIYETYNAPLWETEKGLQVSWSGVLKPYHQAVIAAIRAIDPNNVIVVGTPHWSQYVDEAANDPITSFKNIAYSLKYYAASHKQDLRNRATTAINKNLPIFVTEFGTVYSNGSGTVDQNESNLWWDFLDQNKISYINWSIADKVEGAAALIPGTTAQQVGDPSRLTPSGTFVRNKYLSQSF